MLCAGTARADVNNFNSDLTAVTGTPFVQEASGFVGTDGGTLTPVTSAADVQLALDELFINQAAQGNLAEISSAQLALERSQDPQVRALAQAILDDHSTANSTLQNVFASHDLSFPDVAGNEADMSYNQLANSSDASFDAAFIAAQAKAHQDALTLYRQALITTSDPAARDYAASTLPAIAAHTETIMDLARQWNIPSMGEATDMTVLPALGYDNAPASTDMAVSDIAYTDSPSRYDSDYWRTSGDAFISTIPARQSVSTPFHGPDKAMIEKGVKGATPAGVPDKPIVSTRDQGEEVPWVSPTNKGAQ